MPTKGFIHIGTASNIDKLKGSGSVKVAFLSGFFASSRVANSTIVASGWKELLPPVHDS